MAVCEALHRGMPNRDGIINYITWWQQNWLATHDYRDFLSIRFLTGCLLKMSITTFTIL